MKEQALQVLMEIANKVSLTFNFFLKKYQLQNIVYYSIDNGDKFENISL